MNVSDLILAAGAGMLCLAISATLWAVVSRARAQARVDAMRAQLNEMEYASASALASVDTDGTALLTHDHGNLNVTAGRDGLAACAKALACDDTASAVVLALRRQDAGQQDKLDRLFGLGEPCQFDAEGPGGIVHVQGGAAGALAWLRLTPPDLTARHSTTAQAGQASPAASPALSQFLDSDPEPAWIADGNGNLIWANARWLAAVDVPTVEEARKRSLSFDKAADVLVAEVSAAGEKRERLRWLTLHGQRRAFLVTATPLEHGAVAVRASDVTEAEDLRDATRKHDEAHGETLNHIADAVAIFSATKRLSFHNTAFAKIWGLEPAWLAEGPTHSELLDRLRQRRRLPETADYAAWKARELAHYEQLESAPDDLWTLPDGRTLRVVRQPHLQGGLLLLFSDITGELRLKAQYNGLIQVQQATLDKLNDAVAVFASDGRLRLHNEAFGRFWNVTPGQIEDAGDFDGVAELCVPKLHDMSFWRELKGRVTDPDPQSRIPTGGEARTGDDRIISWQSRPLPDGATLIAFADITDARRLEKAVQDRSAALAEAERLKRDFVGNVSYELRTPLTTIIGYSELLDHAGDQLPERLRGHVASVRSAATQLARSIDDVLDTAQIDAGEMVVDPGDVVICDLLERAAQRFARESAEQDVIIAVDCGPEAGLIRADAERLGQALDHLLENALRQSPRGGRITLTAHRAASEVTLRVTDQGRGIPFHVQAHIFDRFVGRERGGPGLGLALVKALVELHGGWVALESEPGAGSTFTLHLPEVAYSPSVSQSELF
jgi:signal transduction histidine kinase